MAQSPSAATTTKAKRRLRIVDAAETHEAPEPSHAPARRRSSGPLSSWLMRTTQSANDSISKAQRGIEAVERGARSICNPVGLTGVAIEAAWNAAHIAVYPFGLIAERRREKDHYGTHHLTPEQRGLMIGNVEAAGTPILLLHGMIDNRSILTLLRSDLRRRGFARVMTLNYSPFTNDVREAAKILSDKVDALLEETGYEKIHIVAHSLGGIISRYYVQCLGGHEKVSTLVSLGTPHQGTVVAKLWMSNLITQLRPNSDLIAELNAPAPGIDTKFICYWSDLDHLVLPSRNARMRHDDLNIKNVLVRGVGHMSLPIQPRLIHDIATTLHQLDPSGVDLEEPPADSVIDATEADLPPVNAAGA